MSRSTLAVRIIAAVAGTAFTLAAYPAAGQPPIRCGRQEITFGRYPAWSPDGTKIVFECSGICVMKADGSDRATLGGAPGEAVDRLPAWSPDGRHIAFIRQMRRTYLYVMNADGTRPVRLPTGQIQPWSPSWSPDGSRIAFSEAAGARTRIYVIAADGRGTPIRVVNDAARFARTAWSPDGRRISFPKAGGGLVAVGVDGTKPAVLSSLGASDPTWSPDGSTIAFASDVDGHQQIFAVNADGTHPTRLTTAGDNEEPAWSPDGKRIVFTSERDGNPTPYVMNADGSNQTDLLRLPAALSDLAWSPRGNTIAFTVLGRVGVDGIHVIGTDGVGLRRLTGGPDNRDERPAWSPDGQRLAFGRIHLKGGSHIYVMNADGSGLSDLAEDGEAPSWLPDGRNIAFKAFGDGHRPIQSVTADGSGRTTLVKTFDAFAEPVFSPDGQRIAFLISEGATSAVHVMKIDGGGDTRVAANAFTGRRPAWSPDGRRLALTHPPETNRCEGIDVMSADGTERMTLTADMDSYPAWSPDVTRIAFVSNRDGYAAIYIMNADGSAPTRITKDFR